MHVFFIFRSLGRHVSQVKSLRKGYWHPNQLAVIHTLYGRGSNNIWEHALLDPQQSNAKLRRKPNPRDPLYPTKADFIRAKYQNLSFMLRTDAQNRPYAVQDLNRQLHSCVRTTHVETTLRLLAQGAQTNYIEPDKGTTPLHIAAREGQSLQVELLVIYGADPAVPDYNGSTAINYAQDAGHADLAERLEELQYEVTDRLTYYVCSKKPDHR